MAATITLDICTPEGKTWCVPARLDLRAGQPLPRMRTYRGRVMHQVEPAGNGDLRSKCTRRDRYGKTVRRAVGRAEDWSADRHWYPDCKHCPSEEAKST